MDQQKIPIQMDIVKIATTNEPANLIGTPPSSDSGVHSWGEQWENMSTSTTVQFRMTSYDDSNSRADLDPAYGIHLHDPRMMEYMGAPESARLLGRSPEYWVEHMGRDRAVAAALRLHHDASLIMTNAQVLA